MSHSGRGRDADRLQIFQVKTVCVPFSLPQSSFTTASLIPRSPRIHEKPNWAVWHGMYTPRGGRLCKLFMSNS